MSAKIKDCNSHPLVACFVLSNLFVGSLYVWKSKHTRDHPSTIKQRFSSIFLVILISPVILKLFITSKNLSEFNVLELIGLRTPGLLPAAVIPLFLTMVLFLGPLSMLDLKQWKSFLDREFWLEIFTNLIWIRNTIVGPLAEEFIFRACMMPLLLQCYEPLPATFICSLFFGLAHIHHAIERYRMGEEVKVILIRAVVQLSFATLFGAYSAFVFYKTGHFIAPFVIHSFCNIMGFPDFGKIFTYKNPRRNIIIILYITGVVLWYFLLEPLLNQELYCNFVYFPEAYTP